MLGSIATRLDRDHGHNDYPVAKYCRSSLIGSVNFPALRLASFNSQRLSYMSNYQDYSRRAKDLQVQLKRCHL